MCGSLWDCIGHCDIQIFSQRAKPDRGGMQYTSTLSLSLRICNGAPIAFSSTVEVSLACHRCVRANRTIILNESAAAEHFGRSIGRGDHPFDGRITGFRMDRQMDVGDTDRVEASYYLSYEFQPFTDLKYPELLISPQPTWGRVHFTISCPCGRRSELSTQTNLIRPWRASCDCRRTLYVENEQVILFSKALPGT